MTYTVITDDIYLRRARKFFRKHPDLRPTYERILVQLAHDPFEPSLRTHMLAGELDGLWAVRVTRAYRIILAIRITETEIELLDIGGHEVY